MEDCNARNIAAYDTASSPESSLRRRMRLTGFAVPLRAISAVGESRTFVGRCGDGDFCLGGEAGLSSPEESPPARARSSASRSMMANLACVQPQVGSSDCNGDRGGLLRSENLVATLLARTKECKKGPLVSGEGYRTKTEPAVTALKTFCIVQILEKYCKVSKLKTAKGLNEGVKRILL